MNTYALIDPASNQSILFDPGGDPDKLLAMLGNSTPIAKACEGRTALTAHLPFRIKD